MPAEMGLFAMRRGAISRSRSSVHVPGVVSWVLACGVRNGVVPPGRPVPAGLVESIGVEQEAPRARSPLVASRPSFSADHGNPCLPPAQSSWPAADGRRWDHGAMEQLHPPAQWSSAVEAAGWIAERLASFATTVTAVVPAGFEAYARVLHPAEAPPWGGRRVVRWREVAAWSGVSLRPDAQFHTVALPPSRPEPAAPWSGQGPHPGGLYPPDAEVLAEVARGFTTTPEECFFCIWDGYGWEGRRQYSSSGTIPVTLPDPVPETVRRGPRARLPGRDYLLYTGPVEAITAPVEIGHGQTANLAWPADHAWCVASEIDLAWTYVAGSTTLIDTLLADGRLEALPAAPDDTLTRVEPFVTSLVERATTELLATGDTVIATSRGTVEAWLERPERFRPGLLRTRADHDDSSRGSSGGGVRLRARDEPGLRRELSSYLTGAVIGLVGG